MAWGGKTHSISICCPLGMAETGIQWEQFKLAAWGQEMFSAEHRLREKECVGVRCLWISWDGGCVFCILSLDSRVERLLKTQPGDGWIICMWKRRAKEPSAWHTFLCRERHGPLPCFQLDKQPHLKGLSFTFPPELINWVGFYDQRAPCFHLSYRHPL